MLFSKEEKYYCFNNSSNEILLFGLNCNVLSKISIASLFDAGYRYRNYFFGLGLND